MRQTKVFFSLILGALLTAGLFLFLRNHKSTPLEQTELKPSQLDFTQSNELPEKNNKAEKPQHKESSSLISEPQAVQNFSQEEKSQWQIFETLLKTKNDNDPRLDQELKKLSPPFRVALYQKYDLLPPEDHSGRGLIVFLIARNISSQEDIDFLKKIYQETPCLSLANCKSAENNTDPHHSSTDQTTLVYEKLAGLYLIEKQISQNPDLLNNASYRSGTIQVLAQAESYPVPAVHEKARSIRVKYGL